MTPSQQSTMPLRLALIAWESSSRSSTRCLGGLGRSSHKSTLLMKKESSKGVCLPLSLSTSPSLSHTPSFPSFPPHSSLSLFVPSLLPSLDSSLPCIMYSECESLIFHFCVGISSLSLLPLSRLLMLSRLVMVIGSTSPTSLLSTSLVTLKSKINFCGHGYCMCTSTSTCVYHTTFKCSSQIMSPLIVMVTPYRIMVCTCSFL